jgi:autotransporter-associated beta strand protein
VTKTDGGVWVLAPTSPNTFSGALTLNGGLLGVNSNALASTTTISAGGGGMFAYGGSLVTAANLYISYNSWAGVVFAGSNSVTFNGNTALTNYSAGGEVGHHITNSLESGAVLTLKSFLSQESSTTTHRVYIKGTGSTVVTGSITNGSLSATALTIQIANNGSVTLIGTSTFTGGVALYQGTLALDNPSVAAGSSAIGASSGKLTLGGGELRSNFAMTGASALLNPVILDGDPAVIAGTRSIQFAGSLTTSSNNRILQNDLAGGASLTLSGTVALSESATAGRTLILLGAGNTFISGAITAGSPSRMTGLSRAEAPVMAKFERSSPPPRVNFPDDAPIALEPAETNGLSSKSVP